MKKPKAKIKPYVDVSRVGILNHLGSIWSSNTFLNTREAEEYKLDFQRRNPNCNLSKHKVVPVRVTIEAL